MIGEYALPLATAVDYTRMYVDYIKSEGMANPTPKAFTIRATTLLQALGIEVPEEARGKNVRAYLGLDANNEYCLLFTPVLGADIDRGIAGVDVILDGEFKEGAIDSPKPVETGEYVLDFTMPCPSFCNPQSPLFH